jgi:hypothetical protein
MAWHAYTMHTSGPQSRSPNRLLPLLPGCCGFRALVVANHGRSLNRIGSIKDRGLSEHPNLSQSETTVSRVRERALANSLLS